ncbi:hypothetical protein V8C42DRAFT_339847 [Trichoderma barbatum]
MRLSKFITLFTCLATTAMANLITDVLGTECKNVPFGEFGRPFGEPQDVCTAAYDLFLKQTFRCVMAIQDPQAVFLRTDLNKKIPFLHPNQTDDACDFLDEFHAMNGDIQSPTFRERIIASRKAWIKRRRLLLTEE